MTEPLSGVTSPMMILSSVDLPTPFAPTSPIRSPAFSTNDTPFRTVCRP
jgi:hypothetical protein